jgi:succinoglycan biosynthesis transport protein ExoP
MDNQLQPRGFTPEPPGAAGPPPGPGMRYGKEPPDSVHLWEYWHILRRRRWWVLGFFLVVVLAVGVYTFTRTPIYRAAVILQIIQDNAPALPGEPRLDPLIPSFKTDRANKFYETQYKVLTSRPLAYKLIDSLKLSEHPEFKLPPEAGEKTDPEQVRAAMADHLLAHLQVTPVQNTFLVEVAYLSPDKDLARKIANAVHREYLGFSMDTRRQSYAMIRKWLERALLNQSGKVEASQRRLNAYGRANDFLALEGGDNVTVKKFVELNSLLTTAQSQRMGKEARFKQVQEKGADAPLIIDNPLVIKLREEVISQEAKVSSLGKIFGGNYPKLQAEKANLAQLRSRLNGELRRIQTGVKADYEVALRAENFLKEEFDRQKDKVKSLQNNLVEHQALKRDLKSNEELYQGLLARMKEANAASTMMPGNAAVIEPAELPVSPYSPQKARNLGLAMVVGLVGGIGLAFMVEYLDNSIKSPRELERVVRLPALGEVPLLAVNGGAAQDHRQSVGLATYEKPKSLMGDAIYQVSTALLLSLSAQPPAAIMVTSPNEGEGKTTISINLASSLAMAGRRVVFVDADMRRPMGHQTLGLPATPGLSDFLSGRASLREIVQPTRIPRLYLIAAGGVPANPMQLLSLKLFPEMQRRLRQVFQNLIVDTPPIINFADGRVISSLMDGVLLVFKHHATSRESGSQAVSLLNQVNANILGVVLNMAQIEKCGYGEYYGYYKDHLRSFIKNIMTNRSAS